MCTDSVFNPHSPLVILGSLVSGAFAGSIAKTTIAPLDRTKIYFQTTPTAPFSTRTVLKYLHLTWKSDGLFSLFRGNSATLCRIVPYSAIQFTAHEQFKVLISGESSGGRFLAGAGAGVTAQSLTYPLDMTRARLAVSPKWKYSGLGDVFVKVYRNEGITSFWRGWIVTMIGVIPYAGFSFYSYETLKKLHRERYNSEPEIILKMVFGAVSGILGQTSSYPFDIVRRRLQVGVASGSMFSILIGVYRAEGLFRGLYKGLSMNWIKGPIAAGISFTLFDISNGFFTTKLT